MKIFKILSKVLLIIAILAPASGFADSRFEGYGFQRLTKQVCKAAQLESPAQLRRALLKARLHISEVYAYLDCDGSSLLEVAELHQSSRIAAYLKRKVHGLTVEPQLLAVGQP